MNYTPATYEGTHVLLTGPTTRGTVTLADGTTYDVTEPVIEVASAEHAREAAHLIGLMLPEGQHVCNEHCPTV